MSAEAGDDLLARLARGDAEAAESLFAAYAPFLRAVVRCHLSDPVRAKLDSADVVQSVWVQVVRQLNDNGWQISDENQLKGLLATIARRRLVTRIRKHARSLGGDQPANANLEEVKDSRHPPPSEVAQANDLWAKLLELCPPNHHPILMLRRDGLTLDEIAERTGLHEGSVRRILRRLSRDLALQSKSPEISNPPPGID
jgi:RNA polymerase sigma factor (sigma-70 family)